MTVNTYDELRTQTIATPTSSLTFDLTGITGYTDLVLVANTVVSSGSGYDLSLRFNGDTGTNYSYNYFGGTGTSPFVGKNPSMSFADCGYINANSGNPNTRIVNIQNYANTTAQKLVISRGSSVNSTQVIAYTNLWRNTSAITNITIFSGSGLTYAVGSTFSLYGIRAWANESTPKATGGYVSSDANFWYHAFPFSSTFVPNQALSCDVLVVAGGGGGGGNTGGGGGAGGLLAFSSQTISTSQQVIVGSGGAGGISTTTNLGTRATNGGDSQFGSLTLVKGGGGGGSYSGSTTNGFGAAGGSGGGGGVAEATSINTGGAATPSGQGFAGSSAWYGGAYAGGSGGGAGAAATNASANNAGNPGIGATSALINAIGAATNFGQFSSGNYYFAGGGAGAQWNTVQKIGGLGGGGNGGFGTDGYLLATNGVSNLGGGGGGGDRTHLSPNGGSGIVVVRYAK